MPPDAPTNIPRVNGGSTAGRFTAAGRPCGASGETVPLPSGEAVDVGRVHVQDLGDLDAGLCVSRVQVGVTRSDDAIHVEAKGANPTGVQLDGKAWQWLSRGESMDVPLGVIAQLALHKKRPRSTLVDIKSWHPPWSCTKTALIQLVNEMHDLAEQTELSKSIASGTDRRSKVHMLAKLFTVLESQPAPQPAPQPGVADCAADRAADCATDRVARVGCGGRAADDCAASGPRGGGGRGG